MRWERKGGFAFSFSSSSTVCFRFLPPRVRVHPLQAPFRLLFLHVEVGTTPIVHTGLQLALF